MDGRDLPDRPDEGQPQRRNRDISTERVVWARELCGEDVGGHQFSRGRGGRDPKRQPGRDCSAPPSGRRRRTKSCGAFVYAADDLYEVAKAENVVPLGLLTGAKLGCDVPTDKPVTYDMVKVIDNTTLSHLRAMQDAGGAGKFQRAVRDQGCAAGRAEKGGGGIGACRHQFVSRKRSKR